MINLFSVNMSPSVAKAVEETLLSGMIGEGPKVQEFEARLRPFLGVKNLLTVNSCTSALTLALYLADVRGHEVISTPMTCSATSSAIVAAGGKIVWADIDPNTGIIDPESVYQKITDDTRAIVGVDWGGQPCDYPTLMQFGIPVIADAAHAFGGDKNLVADFTAYSFQAIKHLTSGDGGLLHIKNDELFARAKRLRWFGIDREVQTDFRGELDIPEIGFKYHMNDINATIGIENLNIIDTILSQHKSTARTYNTELPEALVSVNNRMEGQHWLYTLLVDNSQNFIFYMQDHGVQAGRVHGRNDNLSCFSASKADLPGVDEFFSKMVCIPIHAGLSEFDISWTIDLVNNYAR